LLLLLLPQQADACLETLEGAVLRSQPQLSLLPRHQLHITGECGVVEQQRLALLLLLLLGAVECAVVHGGAFKGEQLSSSSVKEF
jgi:hypothetical protein